MTVRQPLAPGSRSVSKFISPQRCEEDGPGAEQHGRLRGRHPGGTRHGDQAVGEQRSVVSSGLSPHPSLKRSTQPRAHAAPQDLPGTVLATWPPPGPPAASAGRAACASHRMPPRRRSAPPSSSSSCTGPAAARGRSPAATPGPHSTTPTRTRAPRSSPSGAPRPPLPSSARCTSRSQRGAAASDGLHACGTPACLPAGTWRWTGRTSMCPSPTST